MPVVDADVHPLTPNGLPDLLPYMSDHWRRRLSMYRNWGVGRHPSPIGASRAGAPANFAADARPPAGGVPGSDPAFLREHLLDAHAIDACVLTPLEALYPGRFNYVPDAIHLVRAANDYFVNEWLPVDERFHLAIGVQAQDPLAAAEEIRRLAGTPRVVGVMVPFIDRLLGHPHYHPIYAAAVEAGLPIVLHPFGGEGEFQGNATYPVAPPHTYTQMQALLPTLAMPNVASLVFDGTFQTFPELKVVFTEYGATWLAAFLWRLDDKWRSLRVESPWLEELPSTIVRQHIRFTTQPLEEGEQPEHLGQLLAMMHADELLMFASDYPHWDNDFPDFAFRTLPASMVERISFRNALDVYPIELPLPVEAETTSR
jgi:predicted TIM-barrel fold metal-dependent hydrolase